MAGFFAETLVAGFLDATLVTGFLDATLVAGFLDATLVAGFLDATLVAGFLAMVFVAVLAVEAIAGAALKRKAAAVSDARILFNAVFLLSQKIRAGL